MTPRVSIIIPTRNDAAALATTLEWLHRLEGIHEAEVIVAASGDPLGTMKAAVGRIQVLWPRGSTRAALMNAGAAVARASVLFFVHADSLPPRHALPLIEQVLADERVVGGAFEHRFAEPRWSLHAISWINRIRYRLTHNYYGDQGIFVRASTFRQLGGYREVPLMEDLDLSQRLRRAGRLRLVRTPLLTSGRRFLARGPWRTFFSIVWLLFLHSLCLDTARRAERWRGPTELSPGSAWPRHPHVQSRELAGVVSDSRARAGERNIMIEDMVPDGRGPRVSNDGAVRSWSHYIVLCALVPVMCVLGLALRAHAAAYRDELTFLGKTTFLLREYSLVVPVDLKRQPVQAGTFLEIKAWGAWNGKWVPYVYEPITVPAVSPDDVNAIIGKYRQMKPDARLEVRKGTGNAFLLKSDKGKSRFQLQTEGFAPRLTVDNPEGRLALGISEGMLTVNGKEMPGRVVSVILKPMSHSDASGRYGLYDHFTLQLSSGAVLVVYHSRTRAGFNLATILGPDAKADRQSRDVRVEWWKPSRDAESGRDVPTAWSVEAPDLAIRAELEEWGRNLVRYKTDVGKTAVVSNAMVRGTVEIGGSRLDAFGLNVHVQDE
jgi:rSAM/selenodomain-associated transferase 2